MTISISWRRQFRNVDEIVFASDSRLSAGYRWDCAQKVFPIEGPNFAVSFAGNAEFALPCIFHLQEAVKTYGRYRTGAARIGEIAGEFVRIINQLRMIVDDQLNAQFDKTSFLISGYDHHDGQPFQKKVLFNKQIDRFCLYRFGGFKILEYGFRIGFVGDLWHCYRRALYEAMSKSSTVLDYQPLSALWSVISQQTKHSSVGGMPQIVKVYKSRNYLPYAVKEFDGSQDVFLYGRPLLSHHISHYPLCSLDKIGEEEFIHYPMSPVDRRYPAPPRQCEAG